MSRDSGTALLDRDIDRDELFLTQSAKTMLERQPKQDGCYVFPKQHSLSDDDLCFKEELADKLSNALKPTTNPKTGIAGSNGVTSNFYGLRTVAGTSMNPLNAPIHTNIPVREELGLTPSNDGPVTPRHQKIWTAVLDAIFEEQVAVATALSRPSGTCLPYNLKDSGSKIALAMYYMRNLHDIAVGFDQGDLNGIWDEHQFLIAATIGTRAQVDKITRDGREFTPKAREATTVQGARRGDPSLRTPADKRVFRKGELIPGHFTPRIRTVWGMSACVNYPMSVLMTSFRSYLKRYAFTWKHTTPEEMKKKIKRFKRVLNFDVKYFDQTVPEWALADFIERMTQKCSPSVTNLFLASLHAPYFVPPTSEKQKRGSWVGDPLDKRSFVSTPGLPSGVAYNPDMGKAFMTFVYACVYDDYYGNVLDEDGSLRTFLTGERDDYALLDMGDDAVLMFNDDGFNDHCGKVIEKKELLSPYVLLELEMGASFLGNVIYEDDAGSLQLGANIVNYLLNFWCPEAGIESRKRTPDKSRPLWAAGYIDRQSIFLSSPSFVQADEILKDVYKRHFGTTPDAVARPIAESIRMNTSALTPADRAVLLNPDAIYYKVDPAELSQEIRDSLICYIPEEDCIEFINSLEAR